MVRIGSFVGILISAKCEIVCDRIHEYYSFIHWINYLVVLNPFKDIHKYYAWFDIHFGTEQYNIKYAAVNKKPYQGMYYKPLL